MPSSLHLESAIFGIFLVFFSFRDLLTMFSFTKAICTDNASLSLFMTLGRFESQIRRRGRKIDLTVRAERLEIGMWAIQREKMEVTGKTEGRKDRRDGSKEEQWDGKRQYFHVKRPRKKQWVFKEPLRFEVCGNDFGITLKVLLLWRGERRALGQIQVRSKYTCAHTRIHTYTRVHMYTRTCMHMYTHKYKQICTHTYTHTRLIIRTEGHYLANF